jgi:diguanylate cyclase (GGDEF)-like protein
MKAHDELEQKVKERTTDLAIFQRFAEASGQGFGMADMNGLITYLNPALCRLAGVARPENAIGKDVLIVAGGLGLAPLRPALYHFLKHRKKYGSSSIYAYEAFIDKSEEVFSLMKRYNRDLTIAVIQISNYDDLVRTIGEHEVEEILKQVSITLKNDVRSTDVIGKIRKNAFAVLLPETSANNGFVTISRVSNKINKLPISKTCKISWGIAGLDEKTENVVDLLKLAESIVNDSNRKDDDFIVIYR